MERFKENLETRKEQNIATLVLTICFLIVFVSITSSFSLSQKTAQNDDFKEVFVQKTVASK